MTSPTGQFIWHELLTTDTGAAAAFYGKVAGWDCASNTMNDSPYQIFSSGGAGIAGLMTLPEDAKAKGARPCWMGYVGVTDVDATLAQAMALGGRTYRPAEDIPKVGRFAVIGDPHGAALVIMTPDMASDPGRPSMMTPGAIGWNELMAGELDTAFPFYATLFGWEKQDAVDMGPMGTYQIFGLESGRLGGMMTKPPIVPMPFWQYYIRVAGIDTAKTSVSAAGGTVINGPMEVPGGDWILQGLDPQGVFFALVGPKG